MHAKRNRTLPTTAKASGASRRTAAGSSTPSRKKKSPLLKTVVASLEDAKAEDIITLDLANKGAFADNMVVASGRSNRHVSAIADQLIEKLKETGRKDLKIEGLPHCDWVLVDAGDVVAHIFRPEVRSFYNLEKLWSPDAPADQPLH